MAKKIKKKPVLIEKINVIYLLLLLIIFSLVLFKIVSNRNQYTKEDITTSKNKQDSKCDRLGTSSDLNDIYRTYVVNKGDTLQGIANKQLKKPLGISDLIIINREKYPSLSLQNTYIEVGWVLYLPYDYMKPLAVTETGYVFKPYVEWGEIKDISSQYFTTYMNELNTKRQVDISNAKFMLKERTDYVVGDCVKFVVDSKNQKAIVVFPQ